MSNTGIKIAGQGFHHAPFVIVRDDGDHGILRNLPLLVHAFLSKKMLLHLFPKQAQEQRESYHARCKYTKSSINSPASSAFFRVSRLQPSNTSMIGRKRLELKGKVYQQVKTLPLNRMAHLPAQAAQQSGPKWLKTELRSLLELYARFWENRLLSRKSGNEHFFLLIRGCRYILCIYDSAHRSRSLRRLNSSICDMAAGTGALD